MRTCIKCKKELPLGMFRDVWYATSNICKDCKREQRAHYHWVKMQDKKDAQLADDLKRFGDMVEVK